MKMRQRKHHIYVKQRGSRFGKRCSDYSPGCIVCESWAFYDEHKRFPNFEEAFARVEKANQLEQA